MTKWDLLHKLIDHMLSTMDLDDITMLAGDKLHLDYKNYTEKQLMQEITDWYPELLEEINDNK